MFNTCLIFRNASLDVSARDSRSASAFTFPPLSSFDSAGTQGCARLNQQQLANTTTSLRQFRSLSEPSAFLRHPAQLWENSANMRSFGSQHFHLPRSYSADQTSTAALTSLRRQQLMSLSKKYGLKANGKASAIPCLRRLLTATELGDGRAPA